MKKIILLLSVLVSLYANSQPYQSLFSDTTYQWNIVREGVCDAVCTGEYKLVGTDIFDTTEYHVLSSQGLFSTWNIYVREDTLTGQVWAFDYDITQTEHLVMDLSLGMGDTFILYSTSSVEYDLIVDSVYYENSKKHIRLTADIGFCGEIVDTLTFIEGSGTSAGLDYQMNSNYPQGIRDFLVCHYQDTTEVYHNSYYPNECFICYVGIDEYPKEQVLMFPNPANDNVNISLADEQPFDILITDVLGKSIIQEYHVTSSYTADVSTLPIGIYLVILTDSKGLLYQSKLQVE